MTVKFQKFVQIKYHFNLRIIIDRLIIFLDPEEIILSLQQTPRNKRRSDRTHGEFPEILNDFQRHRDKLAETRASNASTERSFFPLR